MTGFSVESSLCISLFDTLIFQSSDSYFQLPFEKSTTEISTAL